MKGKIWKIVLPLMFFLVGCIGNLESFKPVSIGEASIKEFFVLMEEAWNNKDIEEVLSSYHDDAKIMIGREQRVVSKREYTESLRNKTSGLKRSGIIKYGIPKIKLNGDRAEVRISMTLYEFQVVLRAKFLLVRSDDGWLITERTYTY